MKRVEVEWDDSTTHCEGPWTNKTELDKGLGKSLGCKSVGYLYKETEDRIVLVFSLGEDEYGTPIEIPKGAVTNMVELEPKTGSSQEARTKKK